MFTMKNGKIEITEGTEQSNQERIRTLREKENSEYWGILEANTSNKRR